MKTYKTADGRKLTEEMINTWTSAYEKGDFPKGEKSTGEIVYGRPPLSAEGSEVLSIKLPKGMKRALEKRAQDEGVSASAFARAAITNSLLS